jgi:hypothetical protein
VARTEMPSADNPPGSELVSSELWPHGLWSGRFDFRPESDSIIFAGWDSSFARKIDAILDLLTYLFFLHQRSGRPMFGLTFPSRRVRRVFTTNS